MEPVKMNDNDFEIEPSTRDSIASTICTATGESGSISSITSIALRSLGCGTCYVARDYSHGLEEVFRTKYPKQLRGYVDKPEWKATIRHINELLRKGERVSGWTIMETVLEAASCSMYGLFVPSRKERTLKELVEFIEQQNQTFFIPRRVKISNPLLNGLRHLEIVFLDRPTVNMQPS